MRQLSALVISRQSIAGADAKALFECYYDNVSEVQHVMAMSGATSPSECEAPCRSEVAEAMLALAGQGGRAGQGGVRRGNVNF